MSSRQTGLSCNPCTALHALLGHIIIKHNAQMRLIVRWLSTASRARSRLDFANTREAYRSKSFTQLLRHYLVYKLFAYPSIVENSQRLLQLGRRVLGKRVVNSLTKRTFYSQFVGGEDLESLKAVIGRLRQSGVSAILDYAVEEDVADTQPVVMETRKRNGTTPDSPIHTADPHFSPSLTKGKTTKLASARTYFYQDDVRCQQTMEHFISCIQMAAKVAESGNGNAFAAVKLTGLGRVEFLLRLSEVVEGTRKIFLELSSGHECSGSGAFITKDSFHHGIHRLGVSATETETERFFEELDRDKAGKLSFFEWFNRFQPGIMLHRLLREDPRSKVKPLVVTLNESESAQMKDMIGRSETLAGVASENKVRLMVDAEQTYFQPAIHYITVNNLMPKFNLTTPTIYNTIQSYLQSSEAMLKLDLSFAEESGFMYGVKVVRGAYMEQERALATEKGYPDPIWSAKTETDDCYERLLNLLFDYSKRGLAHIMVASHNEATISLAAEKLKESGIGVSDGRVVFGQLLGMCDHVTFPLGQAGYHAYKYVPYGPVEDVMPYLLRRAHENKGMLEGALRERHLVKTELLRRIFNR